MYLVPNYDFSISITIVCTKLIMKSLIWIARGSLGYRLAVYLEPITIQTLVPWSITISNSIQPEEQLGSAVPWAAVAHGDRSNSGDSWATNIGAALSVPPLSKHLGLMPQSPPLPM